MQLNVNAFTWTICDITFNFSVQIIEANIKSEFSWKSKKKKKFFVWEEEKLENILLYNWNWLIFHYDTDELSTKVICFHQTQIITFCQKRIILFYFFFLISSYKESFSYYSKSINEFNSLLFKLYSAYYITYSFLNVHLFNKNIAKVNRK